MLNKVQRKSTDRFVSLFRPKANCPVSDFFNIFLIISGIAWLLLNRCNFKASMILFRGYYPLQRTLMRTQFNSRQSSMTRVWLSGNWPIRATYQGNIFPELNLVQLLKYIFLSNLILRLCQWHSSTRLVFVLGYHAR